MVVAVDPSQGNEGRKTKRTRYANSQCHVTFSGWVWRVGQLIQACCAFFVPEQEGPGRLLWPPTPILL